MRPSQQDPPSPTSGEDAWSALREGKGLPAGGMRLPLRRAHGQTKQNETKLHFAICHSQNIVLRLIRQTE